MKVCAARRIEPARGFDHPEVALVNQIEQRHAKTAKAPGVGDDEAQVRLHEAAERVFITVLLNLAAEMPLVVW